MNFILTAIELTALGLTAVGAAAGDPRADMDRRRTRDRVLVGDGVDLPK